MSTLSPRKRAIRTAFQAAVAAAPVLLIIIPIILDEAAKVLSPSALAWLAGALAFLVALAAAIARIMALEPVEAWIRRWVPWLAYDTDEAPAIKR